MRIDRLKTETALSETEVMETTVTIQERVTAPSLLGYAASRSPGNRLNGEITVDEEMESMKCDMKGVLKRADGLGAMTVWKVMEILNPIYAECSVFDWFD